MRVHCLRAAILLLSSIQGFAQTSDLPQATALATKSIAALTGGNSISDASLTGDVTWSAGSDIEMGTGTFLAKGTGESRVDLNLSGGNKSYIRNSSGASPAGAWLGSDGIWHPYALHNCWTNTGWFFPVLSSLSAASPSITLSYVGLENRTGISVYHLRSQSSSTNSTVQSLSTMDFYLDASSLLPVAIAFSVHPDNDAGLNILVEVRFSGYQLTNGVQIPAHMQQLQNGTLLLDFVLTSATLNSGLPDSEFAVQ